MDPTSLAAGSIAAGTISPGTRVEVRSRFDSRWSRGFEIAETLDVAVEAPRYLVRRRSDGSVLPSEFGAEELRTEKRGRSMWWV